MLAVLLKTDYNTRIAEIYTKVSSLNGKIDENKTKNKSIKNELIESIKDTLSFLGGNITFDGGDGSQAYWIFQPVHRYFKTIANTKYIFEWKFNGLSDESIKSPPTSDNSRTPLIDFYSYNISVKFNGSISRQTKVSYTHEKTVNIHIVYELAESSSNSDDPTLQNRLFGAVALTTNTDIDKYRYSGYGIGFDRKSSFSFPGGGFVQNEAGMSSSAHIGNMKKDMLVLGKGPTQGLGHTITAEKMYSISFRVTKKKFCLSLHFNGVDSYLFVNVKEIVKFKVKDSAIVATPLCLGNISKDWSVNNMKKTGLNGYVYEFCVDYEEFNSTINAAKHVPFLHNYFMKKYKIK